MLTMASNMISDHASFGKGNALLTLPKRALGTVTQALCYDATDADSLRNLYRRLYNDAPELPAYQILVKCPPP